MAGSPAAVEGLLEHCYTGEVGWPAAAGEQLQQLLPVQLEVLALAERYGLPALRRDCEQRLLQVDW